MVAGCCRGAGKANAPGSGAVSVVGAAAGVGSVSLKARRGPGKPWSLGYTTNPGRGCSTCVWLFLGMFISICRACPIGVDPPPRLPRLAHPALLHLQPMQACILLTVLSKWAGQATGGWPSLYTMLYHTGKCCWSWSTKPVYTSGDLLLMSALTLAAVSLRNFLNVRKR